MNYQQVEMQIKKKAMTVISQAALTRALKPLEKVLVEIMRKRTDEGYDIFGRKFGGYNKSYNKQKALSYAAKKYGTTQFMGNSRTPLRLTGRLFSSMKAKLLSVNMSGNLMTAKFSIFIDDPTQERKVIGLMSETGTARNHKNYSKKAWSFLGISVAGSRKAQEETLIRNTLIKSLKAQLTIKTKARNV